MTDEEFSIYTYGKIKETILQINDSIATDIYAITFYISNNDDDPRQPTLIIGYNTIERWKTCSPSSNQEIKWPIASNSTEAKWNFSFWLQNEKIVIGDNHDESVSAWVKKSPNYYSNEQEELNFDQVILLGEKIKDKFIQITISIAQKLHTEGIIVMKFGKNIPIIIHELEYNNHVISWTNQANPSGLAKEFENWVASF